MVRPSGFEPPTFCSGGKRSIHLSYGRTIAVTASVAKLSRASSFGSPFAMWYDFLTDHFHLTERWLSGRKQRFAKPS